MDEKMVAGRAQVLVLVGDLVADGYLCTYTISIYFD